MAQAAVEGQEGTTADAVVDAQGPVVAKPFKGVSCLFPGCQQRASYGTQHRRPVYCSSHKLVGMRDVMRKLCEHQDTVPCPKNPVFGFPGEKPRFCKQHRLEGMVDVHSKKCIHPNCMKYPSYGFDKGKPFYCREHKTEGTVHVKRTCQYPGCTKYASFGSEPGKPLFCKAHKDTSMKATPRRSCQYPGCQKRPRHVPDEEGKLSFCGEHYKLTLNMHKPPALKPATRGSSQAANNSGSKEATGTPPKQHTQHHTNPHTPAGVSVGTEEYGTMQEPRLQTSQIANVNMQDGRLLASQMGNSSSTQPEAQQYRMQGPQRGPYRLSATANRVNAPGCAGSGVGNAEGAGTHMATTLLNTAGQQTGRQTSLQNTAGQQTRHQTNLLNTAGPQTGASVHAASGGMQVSVGSMASDANAGARCLPVCSVGLAASGVDGPYLCAAGHEHQLCSAQQCEQLAWYGDSTNLPKHCRQHRQQDNWKVCWGTFCESAGCEKSAAYGLPPDKAPAFCELHKENDMINFLEPHDTCIMPDCPYPARWGFGDGMALFCDAHSSPTMHKVVRPSCQHPGCDAAAVPEVPAGVMIPTSALGIPPQYCSNHLPTALQHSCGPGPAMLCEDTDAYVADGAHAYVADGAQQAVQGRVQQAVQGRVQQAVQGRVPPVSAGGIIPAGSVPLCEDTHPYVANDVPQPRGCVQQPVPAGPNCPVEGDGGGRVRRMEDGIGAGSGVSEGSLGLSQGGVGVGESTEAEGAVQEQQGGVRRSARIRKSVGAGVKAGERRLGEDEGGRQGTGSDEPSRLDGKTSWGGKPEKKKRSITRHSGSKEQTNNRKSPRTGSQQEEDVENVYCSQLDDSREVAAQMALVMLSKQHDGPVDGLHQQDTFADHHNAPGANQSAASLPAGLHDRPASMLTMSNSTLAFSPLGCSHSPQWDFNTDGDEPADQAELQQQQGYTAIRDIRPTNHAGGHSQTTHEATNPSSRDNIYNTTPSNEVAMGSHTCTHEQQHSLNRSAGDVRMHSPLTGNKRGRCDGADGAADSASKAPRVTETDKSVKDQASVGQGGLSSNEGAQHCTAAEGHQHTHQLLSSTPQSQISATQQQHFIHVHSLCDQPHVHCNLVPSGGEPGAGNEEQGQQQFIHVHSVCDQPHMHCSLIPQTSFAPVAPAAPGVNLAQNWSDKQKDNAQQHQQQHQHQHQQNQYHDHHQQNQHQNQHHQHQNQHQRNQHQHQHHNQRQQQPSQHGIMSYSTIQASAAQVPQQSPSTTQNNTGTQGTCHRDDESCEEHASRLAEELHEQQRPLLHVHSVCDQHHVHCNLLPHSAANRDSAQQQYIHVHSVCDQPHVHCNLMPQPPASQPATGPRQTDHRHKAAGHQQPMQHQSAQQQSGPRQLGQQQPGEPAEEQQPFLHVHSLCEQRHVHCNLLPQQPANSDPSQQQYLHVHSVCDQPHMHCTLAPSATQAVASNGTACTNTGCHALPSSAPGSCTFHNGAGSCASKQPPAQPRACSPGFPNMDAYDPIAEILNMSCTSFMHTCSHQLAADHFQCPLTSLLDLPPGPCVNAASEPAHTHGKEPTASDLGTSITNDVTNVSKVLPQQAGHSRDVHAAGEQHHQVAAVSAAVSASVSASASASASQCASHCHPLSSLYAAFQRAPSLPLSGPCMLPQLPPVITPFASNAAALMPTILGTASLPPHCTAAPAGLMNASKPACPLTANTCTAALHLPAVPPAHYAPHLISQSTSLPAVAVASCSTAPGGGGGGGGALSSRGGGGGALSSGGGGSLSVFHAPPVQDAVVVQRQQHSVDDVLTRLKSTAGGIPPPRVAASACPTSMHQTLTLARPSLLKPPQEPSATAPSQQRSCCTTAHACDAHTLQQTAVGTALAKNANEMANNVNEMANNVPSSHPGPSPGRRQDRQLTDEQMELDLLQQEHDIGALDEPGSKQVEDSDTVMVYVPVRVPRHSKLGKQLREQGRQAAQSRAGVLKITEAVSQSLGLQIMAMHDAGVPMSAHHGNA